MSARLRFEASIAGELEGLLAPLGEGSATRDGRAFVNGRRAEPGASVRAGDQVEVWGPRRGTEVLGVAVLASQGGLLVAEKPAGLPTTAEQRGSLSLVQLLSEQLGEAVHPASRLDVGVSGVVLCAVGAMAQRHVALAKERGLVKRVYLALAGGALGTGDAEDTGDANHLAHPPSRSLSTRRGVWDSPIAEPRGKAKARGFALRTKAGGGGGVGGEPATTRWLAIAHAPAPSPRSSPTTLLRLEPQTGRRHQLRIHAARAGAPLLGDPEYGGPSTLTLASGAIRRIERVALHASCVSLPDLEGRPFAVRAPVPPALRELWSWVGGDDRAWEDASGDAEG